MSQAVRIPDAGTPAWSEYRQSLRGIGASDAPKVLGLSTYGGPFEFWQQQTGRAPAAASPAALAQPRPRRPPVTQATLPRTSKSWFISFALSD